MRQTRMFAMAMLLGSLMACTSETQGPKGDTGPQGPQGPKGDTGPAGTSRPVTVWRDANNALVGPGLVADDEVPYFDSRGFIWILDASTGEFQTEEESIVYDDVNCTGNAYYSVSRLVRLVFTLPGDPADTFRVLPDTFTTTTVRIKSTRYGTRATDCFSDEYESRVVPLATTLPATPIVKPAINFVGPLRLVVE